MKQFFEEPIAEIFELNDMDIVCTSGCKMGVGEYEMETTDPYGTMSTSSLNEDDAVKEK